MASSTSISASGRVPMWPLPLFVLSGFAGLVLETVLLRQLAWLFGNSARATALVLAAFMGGLALGAVWFGRRADRSAYPIRMFGLLEIGAALSGAALVWLLGAGKGWFLAPLRLLGPGPVEKTVEFLFAFLLVMVPTVLMGGTLPALGRAVIRSSKAFAGPLGVLYGLNTLGASLGVFTAGFFLFEHLGVSRTAYFGAALQAAVGLVAWFLGRSVALPPAAAPTVESGNLEQPGEATDDADGEARRRACLIAAIIGGFAVLGYEVIWTRVLSLFMRSFSYSFSLMLALFLTGLFAGALVTPAVARRVDDRVRVLGWILVAMGVWVAGSILWLPHLMSPVTARSFEGFLLGATLKAAPVVLPPTFLSGLALPLAVAGFSRGTRRVGTDVGSVYAANTVGAIGGALVAGLVLLPWLGAPASLVLLATANALAGVWVLGSPPFRRRQVIVAGVLASVCALTGIGATERFVDAFLGATRSRSSLGELLYFHEGAVDTVAIVKRTYGFRDPHAKSLITNGIAMSATVKPVWRYMALEGHLPVLMARDPRHALAVGVGTGITLGAVVSHPGLESITAVELSDGVIGGLDLFAAENSNAHRDPRVSLLREDGRHFLELTRRRFDVVTLEPPPPIVAGSVHLYSREFYDLCRERTSEGGVVAQWLPLHAQSLVSAKMVARTFLDAFPHVTLWLPSVRDAVLIGSSTPLSMDYRRVQDAFSTEATARNLKAAYFETPEALLSTVLLDRKGIEAWVGPVLPITDERPRMEFFRHQGGNMSDADIGGLVDIPQTSWQWMTGAPDGYESRLSAENRALRLYVRSIVNQDAGARVTAATVSLGSEFFLYPMGCTTEQIAALSGDSGADPQSVAQHLERCRQLRSARTVLSDPR